MYGYREFQSGMDLMTFVNNYGGVGVGMTQSHIVSLGFDPGNGRFFIFYVV